jgi:integrase
LVGLQFYFGLRISAALGVRRDWLSQIGGEWWLKVPAADQKNRRELVRVVPPILAELLLRLPIVGERLLYFPGSPAYLGRKLLALQVAAGFPAERCGRWHCLRRAHIAAMAAAGGAFLESAAQWAGDHGSSRTTSDHYFDIRQRLILRLPRLWDGSESLTVAD